MAGEISLEELMLWLQNSMKQNQNTGPETVTGTPQKFTRLKEYPEIIANVNVNKVRTRTSLDGSQAQKS